jgi:valyl-tRNA synthetase
MLHPFTPFLTEELWGYLRKSCQKHGGKMGLEDVVDGNWPSALISAPWPEPQIEEGWEAQAISDFSYLQEIVRAIRNARAEKNVKPGTRIPAIFSAGDRTEILEKQAPTIALLAKLDESEIYIHHELMEKPQDSIVLVIGNTEIFLPLAGMVDITEERIRMEKELADAESQIARLEKLLDSPFSEKAPANVVQAERDRLVSFVDTANKLKEQLKILLG